MSNASRPILDYGTLPPHSRLKKWARRIALLLLIIASLYGCLLGWLYWGWRREQPAMEMVKRVNGMALGSADTGPAILDNLVPAPLAWIRERKTRVLLNTSTATDEDIRLLQRLTRLQELQLIITKITDAGLVHLSGLTGLKVLQLAATPVTDAGLVHLRDLTGLRALYLGGTHVTDAGLVHLKGLTALHTLDLGCTKVSNAGLAQLKGLGRLQWLYLNDTQVTAAGVADLKKALPNCQIRWTPPQPPATRNSAGESSTDTK